mgnify:FL=1
MLFLLRYRKHYKLGLLGAKVLMLRCRRAIVAGTSATPVSKNNITSEKLSTVSHFYCFVMLYFIREKNDQDSHYVFVRKVGKWASKIF